jgi:hypothetical protein
MCGWFYECCISFTARPSVCSTWLFPTSTVLLTTVHTVHNSWFNYNNCHILSHTPPPLVRIVHETINPTLVFIRITATLYHIATQSPRITVTFHHIESISSTLSTVTYFSYQGPSNITVTLYHIGRTQWVWEIGISRNCTYKYIHILLQLSPVLPGPGAPLTTS